MRLECTPPRGRRCEDNSRRGSRSRSDRNGHRRSAGFVDAIRGSVTERVVRGAPCPVLAAVPSG
ncbi:MAG: universal stress protein [Candidatus Binatia bacterium]